MYCNGTLGIFTNIQKFFDDAIRRGAAIRKEKIIVIETSICKVFGIIHPFIQTNNGSNVVILKIRNISFRRMLVVTYIKKLPYFVKCRKKTIDNNFTCLCMETVSRLEIEYQFDYNCKKRNLKSLNPGRMIY